LTIKTLTACLSVCWVMEPMGNCTVLMANSFL